MRRRDRDPAQRLRLAVESLPRRTREAMLRGIDANPIVVGAYVDHASGGICPMLAAHRNGGRTSLASFARAWDRYTGAKRPRLAIRREVRTLRALLVSSLAGDLDPASGSIADAAAQIRAERAELVARERAPGGSGSDPGQDARDGSIEDMGERQRAAELRARLRWAWMRPARRYDHFKDLVAAAEEQLAERRAEDLLGDRVAREATPRSGPT
jgi:hypothetical protein